MYKDILLNLSVDSDKDPAADYALSVADAFEAHVSAVAYAYEQIIPGPVIGTIATISEGPRLYTSSETTTQGRTNPCS